VFNPFPNGSSYASPPARSSGLVWELGRKLHEIAAFEFVRENTAFTVPKSKVVEATSCQ
jgi:hypothetical protein